MVKILSEGRRFINEKLHDTMIQHSVFAALVFLIVAHPATFKFVDNIINVKNKNLLLLVHAVIVGLIICRCIKFIYWNCIGTTNHIFTLYTNL